MAEPRGMSILNHAIENETKSIATYTESVESFNITEDENIKLSPSKKSQSIWRHWRALLSTFAAAMGSCTIGALMGYTSPAVPDINSSNSNSHFHLSTTDIAVMSSIIALGGIVGVLLGGFLADRFGRKVLLMLSGVPAVVGWILTGCAPNVICMQVGRFLTGISCGVADAVIPVYISEISDKSMRGFMCSFHELFLNIGMMIVFSLGIVLHWNWLAFACITFPVIMCVSMVFAPESPRWLLANARSEEALRVLLWLRGSSTVTDEVDSEYKEMEQNVQVNQTSLRWREFGDSVIIKPILITVALMFLQQMTGYGIFSEYLVSIFQMAKSDWNPYVQTAVVGAGGVVANAISGLVVDRAGRRVMLVLSALLMAASLAGLASFFTMSHYMSSDDVVLSRLAWLPVLSLVMYNFALSLGFGPIPFYLPSELLPLRGRSRGASLGVASCWLFIFITTIVFEPLRKSISEFIIYWIFCGSAILAAGFVLAFVPETNGQSLEEIEKTTESKSCISSS